MNAYNPVENDGNALALPANIGDLCEGRDRSIAHWLTAYDTFHEQSALAAAASAGGNLSVQGGEDRYDTHGFTRAFLAGAGAKEWVGSSYDRKEVAFDARERFQKVATHCVDRRCWDSLMETTGFDKLLDAQARQEFADGLKHEPPPFDVPTIRSTFGHLWENRREIYLRGIANAFMKMDRRFRSHDAFAIGNRLIIDRCFNEWGSWNSFERRDTINDVERIFRELEGKAPLGWHGGIGGRLDEGHGPRAFRIEDEYFKVDRFLNGNVHLWFTNKKLLAEVNKLLLEYYKPVEGDVGEGPSYEAGPLYHASPAKYFGEFFTNDETAQLAIDRLEFSTSRYDSEKRESYDIVPRVLEPSAGGGVFAKKLRAMGADVTCVEIQEHLADGLKRAGFETRSGDFLKLRPADFPQLFDYVVMNPPFDRGRDCDHVRHAMQFLKPGGKLVAIMSARAEFATDARHKALHDLIKTNGDRHGWVWKDLPERSFAHAGTNVNTVTLTLTKKWK